jgi:Ca-activated chloride channel homolog
MMRHPILRRTVAFALAGAALGVVARGEVDGQEGFRFRTGVELVNVTATVSDGSGRFVSGLKQADFAVFEDDQPVDITHFSAERVPVSLGIVLDTSASMTGQKINAARIALERFLFDLLGPDDEIFLYRFDNAPHLVDGWTTDRNQIRSELRSLPTDGATALYDAVAEALPLLQSGRHRKKALLVISDGNDTSSRTDLPTLKRLIRESEALVYAIGIDTQVTLAPFDGPPRDDRLILAQRRRPFPIPVPLPPRRPPPRSPPIPGVPPGTASPRAPKVPPADEPSSGNARQADERVNAFALREITDDSGGRTEVLRDTRDLDPTTARIADELSKQYYLGYSSRARRDGNWHAIRVEVRDRSLRVRARRGYVAAS